MLPVNGTDYTIIVIMILAFAAVAALQFFLCAKAKNIYVKLLPCVFGIAFLVLGIASLFGSTGGFLDLRGLVMFLCTAAAGLCFIAQGAGWLIWKLKNRRKASP